MPGSVSIGLLTLLLLEASGILVQQDNVCRRRRYCPHPARAAPVGWNEQEWPAPSVDPPSSWPGPGLACRRRRCADTPALAAQPQCWPCEYGYHLDGHGEGDFPPHQRVHSKEECCQKCEDLNDNVPSHIPWSSTSTGVDPANSCRSWYVREWNNGDVDCFLFNGAPTLTEEPSVPSHSQCVSSIQAVYLERWYAGGEDRSCDDGCAAVGLVCTAQGLLDHKQDVDTSEKVHNLIAQVGGTTLSGPCETMYGTAPEVPAWNNGWCASSSQFRSLATFDCATTPHPPGQQKQRLCYCHRPAPTTTTTSRHTTGAPTAPATTTVDAVVTSTVPLANPCDADGWMLGDGVGFVDLRVGNATSPAHCAAMVVDPANAERCFGAGGAVISSSGSGACFCEFGTDNRIGTEWQSCRFEHEVGHGQAPSGIECDIQQFVWAVWNGDPSGTKYTAHINRFEHDGNIWVDWTDPVEDASGHLEDPSQLTHRQQVFSCGGTSECLEQDGQRCREEWICSSGKGPRNQYFTSSYDNSFSSCGDLCAADSRCHCFDYTHQSREGACRLFNGTGSVRVSPGSHPGGTHDRNYCCEAALPEAGGGVVSSATTTRPSQALVTTTTPNANPSNSSSGFVDELIRWGWDWFPTDARPSSGSQKLIGYVVLFFLPFVCLVCCGCACLLCWPRKHRGGREGREALRLSMSGAVSGADGRQMGRLSMSGAGSAMGRRMSQARRTSVASGYGTSHYSVRSRNSSVYSDTLRLSAVDLSDDFKALIENNHQINSSAIKFGDFLGKGSFGTVTRCKWQGQEVAVKSIDRNGIVDPTEREDLMKEFLHEFHTSFNLRSPRIVQIYGYFLSSDDALCLVMEFAGGGSIRSRLEGFEKREETAPLVLQLRWASDVALGMEYLHNQGILHRDLKSPNVLLDNSDRGKVADFGLAKAEEAARTATGSFNTVMAEAAMMSDSGASTMGTVNGSPPWMSPEAINGKRSMLSDVYAYGIMIWELRTAKMPWLGEGPVGVLYKVGVLKMRPPMPDDGDEHPLHDLMVRSWDHDEDGRPQFYEIANLAEGIRLAVASAGKSGSSKPSASVERNDSSKDTVSELMGAQKVAKDSQNLDASARSSRTSERLSVSERARENLRKNTASWFRSAEEHPQVSIEMCDTPRKAASPLAEATATFKAASITRAATVT